MAYFHTTVLDEQIKALPTVDTASGAIATFDTDMTENLVEVLCNITPVQTGSGTPSPSNPRPITVYTEMNVVATGKNIFYGSLELGTFGESSPIGSTYAQMKQNSTNRMRSDGLIDLKGQTVTVSVNPNYLLFMTYFDADGLYTGQYSGSFEQKSTISNIAKVAIAIRRLTNVDITPDDYTACELQIEFGSSETTYEPYNGTTSNIPFGQTVANGVLDIGSGKLRVTHKIWQTDGTEIWNDGGNGDYYTTSHYSFDSMTGSSNGLSNYFVYNWSLSQTNGCMAYTNRIQLTKTSYESVADLVADFTNTPLVIVYPLATPIDIQLDSITLQALLNENNIWCDTGDTEVKFLLSVGKKIS